MDVALVEHAEHDIDREQRRGDQDRLVVERLLEDLRGARRSCRGSSLGTCSCAIARSTAWVASLSDAPGLRLNEIVLATNSP